MLIFDTLPALEWWGLYFINIRMTAFFMGIRKYTAFIVACMFAGLLLTSNTTTAQGFYFYNSDYYEPATVIEFGISGGAMNGMTDIGGSKKGKANAGFLRDFTFNKTQFTAGAYLVGTYKDFIAARVDFNFGKVMAADSSLKGTTNEFAKGRYDRNLSFRSNILELAGVIEVHPLFITDYIEREPPRWSPYIFAGVGFAKFNPQANLNGNWYDLEPLRLEGQGFSEYPDRLPYKKTTLSFPLGIGVRWEASQLFTLRFEIARHFLSTDYLDDVHNGDWVDLKAYPDIFYRNLSVQQANLAMQLYNRSTRPDLVVPRNTRPRGNPDDNDAFWNVVFKVGINLNRQKRD